MKRLLKTLVFTILLISTFAFAVGSSFWFGKTLSAKEAISHWGHEEFSNAKFRDADVNGRAKMAAALIENKKAWIGRPLDDVHKQLGPHDGFYFTDTIPAYLVQTAKSEKEETWQVVFLPDRKDQIKDVIIHRQ